jgi:starvation-inducible DNA-binding protein
MKTKKSTLSSKLAVPNNLGEQARKDITKAVNPLVADAFALYVKTKNFHWHLSGPHFRDYHLLFDEQADQIYAMVDVLAERVRKLGGLTIHSIGEIGKLQTIKDDNEAFVEPKDMLKRLLADNKHYTDQLRAAHKVCEKYNDVATTSILEIFLDETERRAWFLYEASV